MFFRFLVIFALFYIKGCNNYKWTVPNIDMNKLYSRKISIDVMVNNVHAML